MQLLTGKSAKVLLVFFILMKSILTEFRTEFDGWIINNSSLYLFVNIGTPTVSWHEANEECLKLGTSLATLESPGEADFVAHIGRHHLFNTEDYWVDGIKTLHRDWTFSEKNISISYFHWCPDEPDSNSNHNDQCIALTDDCDYLWDDQECDLDNHFICEGKVLDVFTQPGNSTNVTYTMLSNYSYSIDKANSLTFEIKDCGTWLIALKKSDSATQTAKMYEITITIEHNVTEYFLKHRKPHETMETVSLLREIRTSDCNSTVTYRISWKHDVISLQMFTTVSNSWSLLIFAIRKSTFPINYIGLASLSAGKTQWRLLVKESLPTKEDEHNTSPSQPSSVPNTMETTTHSTPTTNYFQTTNADSTVSDTYVTRSKKEITTTMVDIMTSENEATVREDERSTSNSITFSANEPTTVQDNIYSTNSESTVSGTTGNSESTVSGLTGYSESTLSGTAGSTSQMLSENTITLLTDPKTEINEEITDMGYLSSTISNGTADYSSVTQSICPCGSQCKVNWFGELSVLERANLTESINALRLLLTINKKNTSSYRRTLVSAEDNRTLSKSIGLSGVALLIMLIMIITIVDMPNLIRMFKSIERNTRRKQRKMKL